MGEGTERCGGVDEPGAMTSAGQRQGEAEEARRCRGCGAELPPNRNPGKPRKWCSERCRKAQYSVPCIDCGAPVHGNDGRGAHERCHVCSGHRTGRIAAARNRERVAEPRARIERMWNEGASLRAIASTLGTTANSVGNAIFRMRQQGYDLPYRRERKAPA